MNFSKSGNPGRFVNEGKRGKRKGTGALLAKASPAPWSNGKRSIFIPSHHINIQLLKHIYILSPTRPQKPENIGLGHNRGGLQHVPTYAPKADALK